MPADRVLTPNRMGWSSSHLSPLSQAFVDFVAAHPSRAPVLDIGAGLGMASLAALATGADVIANDIDAEVLTALVSRTPAGQRSRLQIRPGAFPRIINFQPASVKAIHASSVLHFLTGRQITEGFRAIARWLMPGGKLFIQAASPYQAPFCDFVPEYERRLAAGELWPGWLPKISQYSRHRQLSQMPRSLHLLDDVILARAAKEAGFSVERAWLYRRSDLPANLHLDGRESAGLIATAAE